MFKEPCSSVYIKQVKRKRIENDSCSGTGTLSTIEELDVSTARKGQRLLWHIGSGAK